MFVEKNSRMYHVQIFLFYSDLHMCALLATNVNEKMCKMFFFRFKMLNHFITGVCFYFDLFYFVLGVYIKSKK